MSCQDKNSTQVWPAADSWTYFADSSSIKPWLRCWERMGKIKQISPLINEKPNQTLHTSTAWKATSAQAAKEFLSVHNPASHSSQRANLGSSGMSPVSCSYLFYYKGEPIYPFYTEVGKTSEEGVFQTLQEQLQITRVNEGAWRLANVYATCI